MEYALEERIGNTDLFTGRKEELTYFLDWINKIKQKQSQSTAILARRKMGKTAVLERLFNITFFNNDNVIPFYYEIKEIGMYIVDFCVDFFLTFLYQYIAFKTRKTAYLTVYEKGNLKKALQVAQSEGLGYLEPIISGVISSILNKQEGILWETVRDAPKNIAASQNEFIVQMIDEFQFLNAMIFRTKKMNASHLIKDLAAGYLSTAESKVAPLLISGSWVGWLIDELKRMLPSRFVYHYLENMSPDEAVEMVFKYSGAFDVPVTDETAYLIATMSEGSPFYISSILRSKYRHKNLCTLQGLTDTLEFETLDNEGRIKSTWMEYILFAFNKVNQINAKNIVLYLCQQRDRQVTRLELLEKLALDMTDYELEKKLDALIRADIINQGQSNYEYQGVQDNIFDKVFRGVYEKEIHEFDIRTIGKEYHEGFEKLKVQYYRLLGQLNYQKGHFAEYMILNLLRNHARKINDHLKSITRYLPVDFNFCDYARVWQYDAAIEYGQTFSVDIYAHPKSKDDYAIIGEVKNRDTKKFSQEEAISFMEKFNQLKKLEKLERVIPFIFSLHGFTREAETYCQKMGIACSEDERWLEKI